jgi:hypothetical protein
MTPLYRFHAQELITSGDDPSLVARALDRIEHGDVSFRSEYDAYSIRVRPDLGDNRQKAKAYWIKRDQKCQCRQSKTKGTCSHLIAAKIWWRANAGPQPQPVAIEPDGTVLYEYAE